jgi:hypothetical protein
LLGMQEIFLNLVLIKVTMIQKKLNRNF